MAETVTLRTGDQTLIYVAATLPTDIDDATDAAYKIVGLQIGHDGQSQAQQVEGRNKRVAAVKFGRNTKSKTITAHLSRTSDDGQGILRAAHEAFPKTEIWVIEQPNEEGATGKWYKAQVGTVSETSQGEAYETITFTLGLTSAETTFTVPSES